MHDAVCACTTSSGAHGRDPRSQIPLTEKAMSLLSNIGREHAVDMLLSKTGLWGAVRGKVVSGFNEPELLDDLLDHWTSDFHSKVSRTTYPQRRQRLSHCLPS